MFFTLIIHEQLAIVLIDDNFLKIEINNKLS